MLLRFRVVLLLLYIQTTHIHVADSVAISPIARPSILKSSDYHHSHPNQTSARVRTPDWNSVRLFASLTATYLPMSVGLDGITQSTNIALASSVPVYRRRSYSSVEILSASKDGNIAQKTETLRTNSALAIGGKSVRESRLNSDKVTAAVREKSTQSSHVAGNNIQSYCSNFSGKTDTSASFVQQRTRTAKIVRTASAILQAKPSSPSHTKADLLPSSSFNLGKSEIYHTNASQRKSFSSTAQISKNYREITTLSLETFRSSAGLALCSKIGDACSSTTNYMRTILTGPHNIATSLSLISNTYEAKTPAASGHVSYLSRAEHSTLGLTNNFNQSQVHASLIFTLFQNTSQSNLKTPTTATSSSDIIPITRASQTPRLFNSISYNMITTSSQSMSHGQRSLILEQHSSQGSEDRKTEEIRSSSHFIVLQHSLEQSQMSTTTISASKPLSNDSKEIADIPLYVLAICLPIGFLVGFCLAFVFIKRSKQEQRTQYSVTVEIASDDPNYTMKRMYSIIDMNAGNINKDFWPSLQSDNSSSSIGFELTSQSSDVVLQPSKAPDDDVTDMPL